MNDERYVPTYFAEREFVKANPSCEMRSMDDNFLRKLDHLRTLFGKPILLTSAYRTPDYEKFRGRSGLSYHCKGRAVDIWCTNSQDRAQIVQYCSVCGLNGIGIGSNFIHVDDRYVPTMWLYDGAKDWDSEH